MANTATQVPVAGLVMTSNSIQKRSIVVNSGNHKVYVRSFDANPAGTGNLFVIDGDPSDGAAFKTKLATIPTGIDNAADDLVVDTTLDKVIATSGQSLKAFVVTAANAVTTIAVNQPVADIALDTSTDHAFLTGSMSLFELNLNGTPALVSTTDLGAETGVVAVDTSVHKAYAPGQNGSTFVTGLNKNGATGPLAGLQTVGRYGFSVVDPAQNRLYVLNSQANAAGTNNGLPASVTVVDTTTNNAVTTVPVGNFAFGIGLNPVTHVVYVGGAAASGVAARITAITGMTPSTVDTTAFSGDPNVGFFREFVPNTGTNKIYFRVTNSQNGTSAGVINGATATATPLPTTFGNVNIIKVNSVLNRVYLGNDTGQVYVLNGTDHSIVATLNIGSPLPFNGTQGFIAVDEGNGHVYVSDYNSNSVTVVDGNTNAILATVRTGNGPGVVAVNPSTHRVYVANYNDKSMTFIDGTAMMAVGTLSTPMTATFIAVDPVESRLYTTNGFDPQPGAMVIADNTGVGGLPTLTINGKTDGAKGTVAINGGQYVTYTGTGTGTDTFTYTITDGQATSVPATVTVTFGAPVSITTAAALPAASVGTAYNVTLAATGGIAPYGAWQITSGVLPGGLYMTSAGQIQGTPNASGNFSFTAQVSDSEAVPDSAQKTFTMSVGPLAILTTGLPTATLNSPYSTTLAAGGSAATPFTWTVSSGALPSGLTLNANGTITGTASAPDCTTPAPFTVKVTDATNAFALMTYTMSVTGPIRITTTSLSPAIVLNTPFSSLSASCGSGTRTWSIQSGALPLGVTFPGGTNSAFSGQPKQNGNFPIVAKVTDASGAATQNLTLVSVAIDQSLQPGPASSTSIAPAQRIAQTITVGATGDLTALRFPTLSCSAPVASNPLTVKIEAVSPTNGAPDDSTVYATLSTVTINGTNQILALPAPLTFSADVQLAVVMSSTGTCTIGNATSFDNYLAGAGYADTGSGWSATTGVFDFPVQTLIQNPAIHSLSASRGQTRAVALNNGKILAVSTQGDAQLIDPANVDVAAPIVIPMIASRSDATVTRLSDGRVLVIGGSQNGTTYLNTAEIYDPSVGANGTFTATGSLPAGQGRSNAAAVILGTGNVLITGGAGAGGTTFQNAYVFDTSSQTFGPAITMAAPHQQHTATQLLDGKVLIAGGYTNGAATTAEIYDPTIAPGSFAATGSLLTSRAGHTATVFPSNGLVLIAGGQTTGGPGGMATTGEIFHPNTGDPLYGTFQPAGSMLSGRVRHSATLIVDGVGTESVLLADGERSANFSGAAWASAERYLPGQASAACRLRW